MSFISKEIPTWTIDWVNKVFTLLNTPDYIDDIFMDGAIYVSFTVLWNQITLTDAPTVSLYVDYEDSTAPVNPQTDLIWGDVKEQIWVNLWQTSSSTVFSNSILDAEMNSLVSDIYRGRVQNPLTQKIYRAGALNFIDWFTRFRYIESTILTAALTMWDTVAEMSTVWLLDAWVVLIGWDIITYTSKTDTQIEWISWQTINHLAADRVLPLYLMPEAMDKPTKVEFIVKSTDNTKVELELDNTTSFDKYYQILKEWTNTYIKVVWLDDTEVVEIEYIKKHTNITDDATTFPIPDMYWLSVVANILSWKLWYGKWIPNSEQQLMIWFTTLQSFYQYYTNEINIIKQSLRAKSYGFKSVR